MLPCPQTLQQRVKALSIQKLLTSIRRNQAYIGNCQREDRFLLRGFCSVGLGLRYLGVLVGGSGILSGLSKLRLRNRKLLLGGLRLL